MRSRMFVMLGIGLMLMFAMWPLNGESRQPIRDECPKARLR